MSKEIKLTRGKVAIVCDCHAHLVEGYKWCAAGLPGKYYAVRRNSLKSRLLGSPEKTLMHVVINRTPKGMDTDHIDGNTLNNQCANLRSVTRSQNLQNRGKQLNNSSGYKGVFSAARSNKWRAQIRHNNQVIHIGHFDTAIEAARAYDEKAREFHGEFANTNF